MITAGILIPQNTWLIDGLTFFLGSAAQAAWKVPNAVFMSILSASLVADLIDKAYHKNIGRDFWIHVGFLIVVTANPVGVFGAGTSAISEAVCQTIFLGGLGVMYPFWGATTPEGRNNLDGESDRSTKVAAYSSCPTSILALAVHLGQNFKAFNFMPTSIAYISAVASMITGAIWTNPTSLHITGFWSKPSVKPEDEQQLMPYLQQT